MAEGELDLGDLVETYVPEYPDPIGEAVTIRHLLTHTSGIELDDHPSYNEEVRKARSVAALLETQLRHIEHLNSGSVEGFDPPGGCSRPTVIRGRLLGAVHGGDLLPDSLARHVTNHIMEMLSDL